MTLPVPDNFEELLDKFIERKCSAEEREIIINYLSSSKDGLTTLLTAIRQKAIKDLNIDAPDFLSELKAQNPSQEGSSEDSNAMRKDDDISFIDYIATKAFY